MSTKHLLSAILIILISGTHGMAEEECIFDIENQKQVLVELQNKYQGSKLLLEERTLQVNWDKGIVKYQRGGCDHFGEGIIYSTTEQKDFLNKDILFAQAIKMVKEFFRDMLSGEELEELLASGSYNFSKLEKVDFYFIRHNHLVDLSLMYSRSGQNQVIEVGYYIN